MASVMPDLPSQLQGIAPSCLVPNYTAWSQRHVCEQLVRGCYLKTEWLGLAPVTFELQVQRPNHYIIITGVVV